MNHEFAMHRVRGRIHGRAVAAAAIVGAVAIAPAWAQYTFNPANADEQQPGVRYFGSVKGIDGERIEGATIRLERTSVAFVVVTGDDGRFRADLPVDMTMDTVKITCSKEGFEFVRLAKRPGPVGARRSSVQADCVLRSRTAG